MQLYRAQFRGEGNTLGMSVVFDCDQEHEALDNARLWASENGPVELWRHQDLIARFESGRSFVN